jgi:hypothetical protein
MVTIETIETASKPTYTLYKNKGNGQFFYRSDDGKRGLLGIKEGKAVKSFRTIVKAA